MASLGGDVPSTRAPRTGTPAAMGTAAKRRAQRQRQTSRHVGWLVAMVQAGASHHTAVAGGPRHPGAHGNQLAILAAQVTDLQLQVEVLASLVAGGHVTVGTVKQEAAEEEGNGFNKCKEENHETKFDQCPGIVEPCLSADDDTPRDAQAHGQLGEGLIAADQASPHLCPDQPHEAPAQACGQGEGGELRDPAHIALAIETRADRLEQVRGAIGLALQSPTPSPPHERDRFHRLCDLETTLERELSQLRGLRSGPEAARQPDSPT